MNQHCKSMKALAECSYIKTFRELFCTPKIFNKNTYQHKYLPSPPIKFDKIIEFMELDIFDDIYHDIIHCNHECVSINICDLNFEVIQFLIQNNFITLENKENTFYVIDFIINLFYEIQNNEIGKKRVKEYISYFWDFIVEHDKSVIVNHVDNKTKYTFEYHILNCFDKSIQLEYIEKYNNLNKRSVVEDIFDNTQNKDEENAYVDSASLVQYIQMQNNLNNEQDYIFAI
jgi:hypothetical protein